MYQERARVNWRLQNHPIWRRNVKEPRKERRQAKERQVVVEVSRLSKRELGSLGNSDYTGAKWPHSSASGVRKEQVGRERLTYRDVIIKEKRTQRINPHRIASATHFPSSSDRWKPSGSVRGLKRLTHRARLWARTVETTPILYAQEEDATRASDMP